MALRLSELWQKCQKKRACTTSERENEGRSFFTIYIFSDTLMTRWRQQEIGVRIKKFNQFGNEKRGKRCLLKTRALALNRGRILASARVKLIRHLQYFFHGSPRSTGECSSSHVSQETSNKQDEIPSPARKPVTMERSPRQTHHLIGARIRAMRNQFPNCKGQITWHG